MAVNLSAKPSNAPLPTGQVSRVWGQNTGGAAVLGGGMNYMWADAPNYAIPMRVGPFQLPYRYYLCCAAFYIHHQDGAAAAWSPHIYQLRLVDLAGQPKQDLYTITNFEQYSTVENHGGAWHNASIEGKFYCEANQGYYVQLLTAAVGGGNHYYYTGYRQHLQMFAYTVGDEVY